MNIVQYMQNPMGKGASALMLGAMRKELDQQYSELHSKIELTWYAIDKKFLIAHVRVPSHSVDNLSYDVLVELDIETIPPNISVINPAKVRVFSNCPSFAFTYAKVFYDNGDLIPWAKDKYNKEILSEDPNKRNPIKLINYERSLYLAFRFITSNGRNYKDKVTRNTEKAKSTKKVLENVKTLEEVLQEYNTKKKKDKDKKETEQSSVVKKKEVKSSTKKKNDKKNTTSKTQTTKTVKSTVKTKKIKKI